MRVPLVGGQALLYGEARAEVETVRRLLQWTVGTLWVFAFVACEKSDSLPPITQTARPVPLTAEPAAVESFKLTDGKLEAYLRYQKSRTALYGSIAVQLEKLGNKEQDDEARLALMESKARGEDRAREEVGLSAAEARQIETMVTSVLSARTLAKSYDASDAIMAWERMRDKLPPAQRDELDRTANEMKKQQEESAQLVRLRKEYGSEAVDAILRREKELDASQNAWLNRLSGGKAPR
jgi:hypothetical protein